MEADGTVVDEFKDTVRSLVKWVIVLVILVLAFGCAGAVYAVWDKAETRQDVAEINGALCTFKGDLVVRVQSAEQFLKDHPDGLEGISAESIQQSIDNQQRTINSLSQLNC